MGVCYFNIGKSYKLTKSIQFLLKQYFIQFMHNLSGGTIPPPPYVTQNGSHCCSIIPWSKKDQIPLMVQQQQTQNILLFLNCLLVLLLLILLMLGEQNPWATMHTMNYITCSADDAKLRYVLAL